MSSVQFNSFSVDTGSKEDPLDLIAGMFFDGTGNNRKNARARKIYLSENEI